MNLYMTIECLAAILSVYTDATSVSSQIDLSLMVTNSIFQLQNSSK